MERTTVFLRDEDKELIEEIQHELAEERPDQSRKVSVSEAVRHALRLATGRQSSNKRRRTRQT